MSYTKQEILDLANPYELFRDGDVLAEHRDVLNGLSEEAQKKLAIKIIADCPKEKLKDYHLSVMALSEPQAHNKTFYSILNNALQVKTRLWGLLDHRNTKPHVFLLEESTPDLLNEFTSIAKQVLAGNETAIAERLALHTPPEKRSALTKKVMSFAWKNNLAEKIGNAFSLQYTIEKHLLGDEPEHFFINRDFNRDRCLEFSGLIQSIKDKEKEIGRKLALSPLRNLFYPDF